MGKSETEDGQTIQWLKVQTIMYTTQKIVDLQTRTHKKNHTGMKAGALELNQMKNTEHRDCKNQSMEYFIEQIYDER